MFEAFLLQMEGCGFFMTSGLLLQTQWVNMGWQNPADKMHQVKNWRGAAMFITMICTEEKGSILETVSLSLRTQH
jgi:hypothetical protein